MFAELFSIVLPELYRTEMCDESVSLLGVTSNVVAPLAKPTFIYVYEFAEN